VGALPVPAAIPAPAAAPNVTPPQRSLRPGGGLAIAAKLNTGAQNAPKGPKREYSKDDLMKLRPTVLPDKPAEIARTYSGVSDGGGRGERSQITGYWQRVAAGGASPHAKAGGGGDFRGGGGGREERGAGRDSHGGATGDSGGDRWDRGKQGLPPAQDVR
jgi:hypothetical protein